MSKGIFVRPNRDGKSGMIEPEGKGKWVFFYLDQVEELPSEGLQEGMRLEFESEMHPKGPRARRVRYIGEAASASPKSLITSAVESVRASNRESRFLNPYNFVRFLKEPNPTAERLVRTCPPPPHDRYVGINGKIVCRLKNLSPLFVSDAEKVGTCFDEHHIYRSFKIGERFVLPASSLRGMIRNVFEAATNSCMAVFEDARLSMRVEADIGARLVPARVEKVGDEWNLRLLIGTSPLVIGAPSRDKQHVEHEQYAAWLHRHWPIKPSDTIAPDPDKPRQHPDSPQKIAFRERTAEGNEIDIGNFVHGQKCFARLVSMPHAYHQRIKFWDVLEVSEDEQALKKKCVHGQRVEEGYLCLNNKNTERKHSERFFFRAKNNKGHAELVTLPPEVCDEYEKLIEEYQERHKQEVADWRRRKQPLDQPRDDVTNLSRFVYEERESKLREGALVYAFLKGTPENPDVEFIAPVLVPRVLFKRSIAEVLKKHHHHLEACKQLEDFCPACRVFGWVRKGKAEDNKSVAVAGRVKFSQATLQQSAKLLPNLITLAILSSPQPTTTRFYLMPSNGSVPESWKGEKAEAGYDDANRLRGRKFYRRHSSTWFSRKFSNGKHEYERIDGRADKQNRTVAEVLAAGNDFKFEVRFDNMAPIELGALLWALEMEENMVHRLGYAKPLGFGNVKIEVTGVEVLNFSERYKSLDNDGIKEKTDSALLAWKKDYVDLFKRAMSEAYPDRASFLELDNIKDLSELLGKEPALPVHYPRPTEEPDAEGKQFEWFMHNKREKEWKFALPLAPDDTKGFLYLPQRVKKDQR